MRRHDARDRFASVTPGTILREKRNCWRRPHAGRVALLVDGEAYFAALADAIERAERQILMVGWDFHSRVRLRRDPDRSPEDDADAQLVALLERRVRAERHLRVHILAWDFAMIYALEREWQPLVRFEKKTHRRISYRLDDRHPVGGSHHQKLVVIDDALAFSGGLDVAGCRWDTRDHPAHDPRRNDPGFPDYAPFHDVQIAVDGEAAQALGELARERWQRATDRELEAKSGEGDPWPPDLRVDFRDVAVGISRTQPAWRGADEIREVEALWRDAIRAARHAIYIENQYLTSHVIRDALAERLREPGGPEVVAVVPADLSGWLERSTMGVITARLAKHLREADRHGRLRLVHPTLPERGDALTVHAKVLIVDDRLLRVGSANASNRSMGLDTECDLSLESTPERDLTRGIAHARNDLLAEHLGVKTEEVEAAIRDRGSLVQALDALAGGDRTLAPLEPELSDWVDELVPDAKLFDPERPIALEELWDRFSAGRDVEEKDERGRVRAVAQLAAGVAAVAALAVAWNATSLGEWVAADRIAEHALALRHSTAGLAGAVALFAVASALLVPVTGLIAASGLVFGFLEGSLVALSGSLAGAAVGYGAGRTLWRDAVRRLAGPRLDRVSRRLGERGLVAAAALRVVPVAPFAVVNLVAGASHIRARDFLLGTLLGMTPGTLALVFFADRALAAVVDPSAGTWLGLAAGVLAVVAAAFGLRAWLRRRREAAGATAPAA